MRIIPKIDIKGPNLVKGIHLEGLRALGQPKEFISKYYKDGADEIIFHDIVASLYGRNNLNDLITISSKDTFIPLSAGGGVRNENDVRKLLLSGADRVFVNSAMFDNNNLLKKLVKIFGSSTIISSIEVLNYEGEFYCFKDFGRENTGIKLKDWFKKIKDAEPGEILLTSIDKDGTRTGFDIKLIDMAEKFLKLPYMINGGYNHINNLKNLLNAGSPSAIVISTALHYDALKSLNLLVNEEEGNFEYFNSIKKSNKVSGLKSKNIIKEIKKELKKYV